MYVHLRNIEISLYNDSWRTSFLGDSYNITRRLISILRGTFISILTLWYVACEGCFFNSKEITVQLPQLPHSWYEYLGPASWCIVWYDAEGTRCQSYVTSGEKTVQISFVKGQQSPLLAYPYWTAYTIPPGYARPAGAIFPINLVDSTLVCSWIGGVSANLYILMAGKDIATEKRPEFFNWYRFFDLFSNKELEDTVLQDPWCVDWNVVAQKAVSTGFNKRQLVARATSPLSITVPYAGPWVAASPFIELNLNPETTEIEVLASREVDSLFSKHGIIRYTQDLWIFIPD